MFVIKLKSLDRSITINRNNSVCISTSDNTFHYSLNSLLYVLRLCLNLCVCLNRNVIHFECHWEKEILPILIIIIINNLIDLNFELFFFFFTVKFNNLARKKHYERDINWVHSFDKCILILLLNWNVRSLIMNLQ